MPTAKKLAEDEYDPDSPPPSHRPSTRPKPRPTGKAATNIKDPKTSDYQVRTSKKVRQSVTWAESDTSMIDCNAGEGEVTEEEEEEDGNWDDMHEDDEDVEDVAEVKRHKATAGM